MDTFAAVAATRCQWCDAAIDVGGTVCLCSAVRCKKVLCLQCREVEEGQSFCYDCFILAITRTPPSTPNALWRAFFFTATPTGSASSHRAEILDEAETGEEEQSLDEEENEEETSGDEEPPMQSTTKYIIRSRGKRRNPFHPSPSLASRGG